MGSEITHSPFSLSILTILCQTFDMRNPIATLCLTFAVLLGSARCQTTDRQKYMGGIPPQKLNDRTTYTSNVVGGIAYIRATYTEYSFLPPRMAKFKQVCLQIAFKTAAEISKTQNNALRLLSNAKIKVEVSRDKLGGNNICAMNFPMTVNSSR